MRWWELHSFRWRSCPWDFFQCLRDCAEPNTMVIPYQYQRTALHVRYCRPFAYSDVKAIHISKWWCLTNSILIKQCWLYWLYTDSSQYAFNPLNAELNPICHLLALLGGATMVVVSRLRVKKRQRIFPYCVNPLNA